MSFIKNLLLSSAALVANFASHGQEIVFDINHNQRSDYQHFLSSPGETDTKYVLKVSTEPKDSLVTDAESDQKVKKPVVAIAPQKIKSEKPNQTKDVLPKSEKETDESILSFNFLYYIIQKYKLQDIVD